ncbi:MAG TPA: hypothetical protein VD694_03385, partial [Nitrososphaeraceae archaeon]|nr:hypothetical protein [Nitrososphaeraceae archaeon]
MTFKKCTLVSLLVLLLGFKILILNNTRQVLYYDLLFQKIYARTAGFNEIAPKWANKIMTFRQEGFPFPLSLAWWKLYFALDSPSK